MAAFRFHFTERQIGAPSGLPKKRKRTVAGLNELDARCKLNKLLHKMGVRVHAILDVEVAA